jgi:hypothetical protein
MVLRAGLVSRRRARHVLSVVSALLLLNASLRLARGRDLAPELLQLAFLPRLLDAVIALLRLLQFAFELMLAPSLSLVLDLLLALHQPLAGVEAYDRAARRLMGRPIIDRAFCRRCGAEVLRLHSDANDCEKRRGCEFRDHSDFPGVHCTDWKPPMLGSRVLLEIVFKRVKSALPARIATGWRSGQGSLRQLIY